MNRVFDSHSMYRIFHFSKPTGFGCCLAWVFVSCVGCNQQPAPNATGTIPLSEVAVPNESDPAEVLVAESVPSVVVEQVVEAPPPEPVLRVSVAGAKSTDGVYFCALFDSEEKLEQRSDPVIYEKFPATEAKITWEIETLPPGRYSIAAFHDANENGKFDRHALGYPMEAYGFSNNARGKFGPPPYEKIEFEVGAKPLELTIQLK